jgi:hypothetical protein
MSKRHSQPQVTAASLTPATRDPQTRGPTRAPEDHPNAVFAKSTLRPTIQAGLTLREVNGNLGELSLESLVNDLRDQCDLVAKGELRRPEAMLVTQAHTLDALFHFMARRALANMGKYTQAADTYMRLALRAQAQARATVETLAEMKNPKPVAFVRQANIAHGPQQVNNGPLPARAENGQNQRNELLESDDGERLDTGKAGAAGGDDPPLETVGAVHGTSDDPRKSHGRT